MEKSDWQKRKEIERAEKWDATEFDKQIKKFTPRIQKDLKTLSFPTIKTFESAYLFGIVGSGKTIYAIFMFLAYLRNSFIMKGGISSNVGEFITVPNLLLKFKRSYDTKIIAKGDENDEIIIPLNEYELVEYYSNLDFLILDDFGVEKTTEWSFQLLYIIINNRYEYEKITVFTSNYSLQELAGKLGDERITSRIQQMCRIIEKDINYRK
jgi:DNA replication protein DnaC